MGNSNSADKVLDIKNKYALLSQLNNQVYGEGKLLRHLVTDEKVILKEIHLVDKKQYEKWSYRIKQRQEKPCDNIIKLKEFFNYEEKQLCSNYYKLYMLFEYVPDSILNRIGMKRSQKKKFNEQELWTIISGAIKGLATFQEMNIAHQNVRPQTLCLAGDVEQGDLVLKVCDTPLLTNGTAFGAVLQDFTGNIKGYYLSPILIKAIHSTNYQPVHNAFKSDVFSLGMTLLHTALLQQCDHCYLMNLGEVNEQEIQGLLQQVQHYYTPQIQEIISDMLIMDENERPDFIQLRYKIDSQPKELEKIQDPIQIDVNLIKQSNNFIPDYTPFQFDMNSVNPNFMIEKPSPFAETYPGPDEPPLPLKQDINDYLTLSNVYFKIKNQITIISPNDVHLGNEKVEKPSNFIDHTPLENPHPFMDIPVTHQQISPSIWQEQKPFDSSLQPILKQSDYRKPIQVEEFFKTVNVTQNEFKKSKVEFEDFNKPFQPQNDYFKFVPQNLDYQKPLLNDFPNTNIENNKAPSYTDFSYKPFEEFLKYNKTSQIMKENFISEPYKEQNFPNFFKTDIFSDIPLQKPTQTFNDFFPKYEQIPLTDINTNQKAEIKYSQIQEKPIENQFIYQNQNKEKQQEPILQSNHSFYPQQDLPFNQIQFQPYESQPTLKQTLTLKSSKVYQDNQPVVLQQDLEGYYGEKRNGQRNGYGKQQFDHGGYYEGYWKNDKMDGIGTLYYANGKAAYDGQWQDDKFEGQGALYNETPDKLRKQFDYRNFDNLDNYWEKYIGGFKDDSKSGFGTLHLTNGEYYEGQFVEDLVDGNGKYFQITGQTIRGKWRQNQFIQQI